MSLEECTGDGCVANHGAIADLIDGKPACSGLAAEFEKSRLLAARLLDQARFQHEVLAEIYDLANAQNDDAQYHMRMISIKSAVAMRAAQLSGLLS